MKTGTRTIKTVEITSCIFEQGKDFNQGDIEPWINGLNHLTLEFRNASEEAGLGKLIHSGNVQPNGEVKMTFEKELFV